MNPSPVYVGDLEAPALGQCASTNEPPSFSRTDSIPATCSIKPEPRPRRKIVPTAYLRSNGPSKQPSTITLAHTRYGSTSQANPNIGPILAPAGLSVASMKPPFTNPSMC